MMDTAESWNIGQAKYSVNHSKTDTVESWNIRQAEHIINHSMVDTAESWNIRESHLISTTEQMTQNLQT